MTLEPYHCTSCPVQRFVKFYAFRGSEEAPLSTKEESSNYGEALRLILDRCIPLVVLGRKNLSKSWLPKSFGELYQATLVFQEHMTKAYENEIRAIIRDEEQEHNLITSLIRALQVNFNQNKNGYTSSHQEGFTEEEICGKYLFSILRATMQRPTL